jgi:hypothetical protein
MNILLNLNNTMCHVFIKDQKLMPFPIKLFESLFDDQLVVKNQDVTKE